MKSGLMRLGGLELLFLFGISYAVSLPMLVLIIMMIKSVAWCLGSVNQLMDKDIPNRIGFGTFCAVSFIGILWLIHVG